MLTLMRMVQEQNGVPAWQGGCKPWEEQSIESCLTVYSLGRLEGPFGACAVLVAWSRRLFLNAPGRLCCIQW